MIGVLVSGAGTNLQALLDDGLPVVAVASNNTKARALDRAARAGVEAGAFPTVEFESREQRDAEMAEWLAERGVELVVLAGYMQLLTPAFLDRFPDRILNVHPSLLPSFPGAHAVEDALAHGVKVTGATVHFVDEGVDTGAIMLQEAVEIREYDTAETLHARIQDVEHRLLPRAVRLFLDGKLRRPVTA
ncbi:MAG TPA: phosphoribosylglycinamide formyltransferase [Gaiellaceae bacterium]|jgi:phosphoribosylglycinamide formyltransferase 1|nr:phosphoribosylglycinamide formyltransferase [Gaiellaceae bacterium]